MTEGEVGRGGTGQIIHRGKNTLDIQLEEGRSLKKNNKGGKEKRIGEEGMKKGLHWVLATILCGGELSHYARMQSKTKICWGDGHNT